MRVRCSAFVRAATMTSSVLSNCSQRDYAPAMTAHKRESLESHRLAGLHVFTRPRSRHGVLCSCESTRNEGGTGSSMCGNHSGSDSDCAKETEGCQQRRGAWIFFSEQTRTAVTERRLALAVLLWQ